MSKGAQIAVGATAIAALLGWLALSRVEAGFTYYQTLAEFHDAAVPGEPARVHGYVAEGSIDRDVAAKAVRFAVQNDPPHAGGEPGRLLPVVFFSLETPDLFKDGAEVVVEGRFPASGDATFHADKVMAKCPSKFEGMDPTQAASLN